MSKRAREMADDGENDIYDRVEALEDLLQDLIEDVATLKAQLAAATTAAPEATTAQLDLPAAIAAAPPPPREPSHTRALMVFIAKRHMKEEAEFHDESNQVEGPSHRWICTFKLGGKELGRSEVPSKRHAKQLASEPALKVLLEE